MGNSLVSSELVDAYASTNYVVENAPSFTLRVGVYSEQLEKLYVSEGVQTACFITAYNPFSVLLTTPHNVARQAVLLTDVAELKLKSRLGYGENLDKTWREQSIMVLGISYEMSMELAIKHEQNAFIWCDEQATPMLVLTQAG